MDNKIKKSEVEHIKDACFNNFMKKGIKVLELFHIRTTWFWFYIIVNGR